MRSEKVLVTGAGGFIGASVVRRLYQNNVEVLPTLGPTGQKWRLEDLPLDFVSLDVTDRKAVFETIKRFRPTHVVNMATYGVYRDQNDSELIYRTNTIGVTNLLQAAGECDIELFVNTGSVYEYGSLPGVMTEDMQGDIRGPYDEAKTQTTQLAQKYHLEYGLPVVTLRLFTTYGPHEDKRRLVAGSILKALKDEEIIISPKSIRDFVYVNDVADAYWDTLTHGSIAGQTINIGSGEPHTVDEVVEQIRSLVGSGSQVKSVGDFAPKNDSRCWADISKAKELLGWSPAHSLEEGLQETIEWYKTNAIKYKQYE